MNEKQETVFRILIFVVLVWLVMIITPRLFPGSAVTSAPQSQTSTDSATRAQAPQQIPGALPTPGATTVAPAAVRPADSATAAAPSVPVDSTIVRDSLVAYSFTNHGASANNLELLRHRQLGSDSGAVEILRPGEALLRFKIFLPGDTIDLSNRVFSVDSVVGAGGRIESLRYSTPLAETASTFWVEYKFVPNSYMAQVRGGLEGGNAPSSFLVIQMPSGLYSNEANLQEDLLHYAVAYKRERGDVTGIGFGKLDPRELDRSDENARVSWVAVKSKYFIVAILKPEGEPGFLQVEAVGGARQERAATHVITHVVEDLSDSAFQFDLYSGPQEFKRLVAAGRDFQNSNPYGGFLQPLVQPFAVLVMKALLWLKSVTNLNYGWVLIIFGVLVRLLLWPLNQKAMRTTMRMQRLQPELTALQEKHKGNPQKLQEEMMRVYKDHGMTPFSPLAGCLPMLIPMPVLFALFFVFQNTIEFRGVSFLWLPDISQKDPTYIVPIFMGISMYVMSWMGSRNAPPNPQMKMMTYMLPAVFTVLFLNFASGLNLYYAVQNVAALPQQWLIARERSKAGLNTAPVAKPATTKKPAADKPRK